MDQITITDVTDGEKGVSVKIVTPFYALGTAAPDKPTTNSPASIWTTTEPEYVKGKNLYTTQRTVLEDSTFSYSDVSLDSSYKASEQAITTADTANTTAGEAKTTAGEAKTTAGEAKTTAGEAKTTAGEAKTTADEAKTASTTNKNNLESEITARNEAVANLKTSIDNEVEAVSQKAADAQKAADNAASDLSTFRTSTESQLTSVNGLVSGLRTDVNAVTNKANTLSSGLDTANTKITSTSDNLTGLTTTVSNVSKTADDAMALSTTNHQDLAEFKTTVQQTYNTKEETLSQVSAVSQKADAISATLSKDYQKTADSDAKYSTKAELTATSNSITASVAETYATKSVVDALKNIADNAIETWQGHGIPSMTGKPTSDWSTDALKKQHSGDMYYDLDSGYSYRFGSEDGTTYAWSKIADSDIAKAMQAAAAAQSSADTANAGVSKLNTDIPATYATKSDVKITTDGIKTDVSKAMTLGQTGIDNAATVDHKADGIQATVTQQAKDISDNVKAIAQVNLRADGISTSVSQVDAKADVALANAQELVRNPTMRSDVSNPDGWPSNVTLGASGAPSNPPTPFTTYAKVTGRDHLASWALPNIPGRVFQYTIYAVADSTATHMLQFGVQYSDSGGNMHWSGAIWVSVAQGQSGWAKYVGTFTVPDNISSDTNWPRPWLDIDTFASDYGWYVTGLSIKDITESAKAQGTADTAISQVSTLSQDVEGFKTQVTQTYETKDASTAKATTAQQNLEGFRNTVSSTYATKTALDTINGNVTQAQATGDQAIFAALPSLADKTQANSWLCGIFPTGNGSVQTLPSYSLIASLAASYTKYSADSGDILRGSGMDYHYGLIRTLVSFAADTTWTFAYSHDDGSRIYVDGIVVFENINHTQNDSVTINFTKGNHIVDVMYSNSVGEYGIWGFSVALSSIATTMYAPAGASVIAQTYATKTALDTINGNVTQAQATGDQAIFAALPSLADKTQANSWLCGIFPTGNGSVQTLPSYSLIASLAASYTKYSADSGDILRGSGMDYHYGLIRTLVSFAADTTWTFAYSHDDGSRIYVDGIVVFENINHTQNDSVTINFTKGNHIVDVMYSNSVGEYGIWGFSVALSSIATTMYAPAGASVIAQTYSTKTYTDQTATQITSQVETKYATKDALSQTDSKVDQKVNEWSVQLSTISSRADAITQTTDNLSDQLATTNSNVNNINGTLSDEITRRQAYMRFSQEADGNPALELGASSSSNKVVLTNDRLSFKSNNTEVAYIGNDQMNINNANVTRTLRIGNFMLAPRADGHLTLTRV
jgi:hypothetical protein